MRGPRVRSGCPLRGLLVVVALLAGCRSYGVAAASVPMDDAFGIHATIGGAPVRLLLDTGCTRSALTRAAVDRLGLPLRAEPEARATDASGVARGIDGVVPVTGLRIGATTWVDFEMWCAAIDARFRGDGFIGMEVLGSAVWWFDATAKVVHMVPSTEVDGEVEKRGHRVVAKLPLGDDRARPFVCVRLDGRAETQLLLDSGAQLTSLPQATVASLALPPGADAQSLGVFGVLEQRSTFRLPLLELGGLQFRDLVVTDNAREALLGRDVLGAVPWLLHGPRHELWLLVREGPDAVDRIAGAAASRSAARAGNCGLIGPE